MTNKAKTKQESDLLRNAIQFKKKKKKRVQFLGNPLTLQINPGKSIIFKAEHTSKFRFGMYTETVRKRCH